MKIGMDIFCHMLQIRIGGRMKAYEDKNCGCYKIEKEINEKYPSSDWNNDEVCKEWRKRGGELKDNNIEFEDCSDEYYGCTCPTCGRMICGWCV